MKGMRGIAPFGLRMPDELRESIAERAKSNNRSINSEIVQRLEASIFNEISPIKLISAEEAKLIASRAKKELVNIIFQRCIEEINRSIRLGQTNFTVQTDDIELELIDEKDFNNILSTLGSRLKKAGYILEVEHCNASYFSLKIP